MNPNLRNTLAPTSRRPVNVSAVAVTSIRKLGPTAMAERIKRKNVDGQMANP